MIIDAGGFSLYIASGALALAAKQIHHGISQWYRDRQTDNSSDSQSVPDISFEQNTQEQD